MRVCPYNALRRRADGQVSAEKITKSKNEKSGTNFLIRQTILLPKINNIMQETFSEIHKKNVLEKGRRLVSNLVECVAYPTTGLTNAVLYPNLLFCSDTCREDRQHSEMVDGGALTNHRAESSGRIHASQSEY